MIICLCFLFIVMYWQTYCWIPFVMFCCVFSRVYKWGIVVYNTPPVLYFGRDCFEGTSVLRQRFDKLSMCPGFTIRCFLHFSWFTDLYHQSCHMLYAGLFVVFFFNLLMFVVCCDTLFHFWYWQFMIPFSFFPLLQIYQLKKQLFKNQLH